MESLSPSHRDTPVIVRASLAAAGRKVNVTLQANADDEIIVEATGKAGVITGSRPHHLGALSLATRYSIVVLNLTSGAPG